MRVVVGYCKKSTHLDLRVVRWRLFALVCRRRDHPEHPETEYECRTREMGAVVYGICATPGARPTEEQIAAGRAQEQSLAYYLPDDLDELTYVPLGMEEAVENFKNRARKGKKRLPQES